MNVDLNPELEQLVHSSVESGRYNSPGEVVGEALRLLADRDLFELQRAILQEKIAKGLDSLRRGEGVDGEEFFAQLDMEAAELEQKSQPA